MGVVFMAGFDTGATLAALPSVGTALALESPRAGAVGYCTRVTDTKYFQHQPGTPIPQGDWLTFGGWFKVNTASTSVVTIYDSGSALQFNLVQNTSQQMEVRRGSTSVATSTAGTWPTATWTHVQVSVLIADSGGRIVGYLNGTKVVDFTGDTRNGGTGNMATIRVWASGSRSNDVDDFWIDDENAESALRYLVVRTLVPDAAGASTDWTPSTGTNYGCVGDDSDATYVGSMVGGDRDLYGFSALDEPDATVEAVQLVIRGQQVGAGAPTVRAVHRAADTTVSVGTAAAQLPTVDSAVAAFWAVNPATSASWTPSEVDGSQFGFELVE